MRHLLGRDLTIRPATNADRPRLFEIWRDAVNATHDFVAPADMAEITERVLENYFPETVFTVATDKADRAIGFIEVEHDTQIGALFVDPAHHGRGVGTTLVREAMPQGVPLTVEVNEQNHVGRAIYEHWGFNMIDWMPTDMQGRPYPLILMQRD